jgi:hypothetical protein
VFAPVQFIFSARVRNTYDPLDLSRTLRIPIAVTLAVAVLNMVLAAIGGTSVGIALPPSLVRRYYDQRDHVQDH